MKMPQRSFVVEFKSRSRQTKVNKSASIWGDTDLKAALSQVKEQSAHLFNQPDEKPAIKGTTIVPAEIEQVVSDLNEAKDLAISTMPEASSPRLQPSEASPANFSSEGNAHNSKTRIAERPAIRSATRTARRRANKAETQLAQPGPPTRLNVATQALAECELVSLIELGALEAENRELKLALHKKLSADNTRLKEMLRRFL